MATYAVILNNQVINTIDAPSLEVAEEATGQTCIEYTLDNPAYIGLSYDGTTFEKPIVIEEILTEEPTSLL